MRVRQREKAYSIATLKEYVPDYESRDRVPRRRRNEVRTSAGPCYEIIQRDQRTSPSASHFPITPPR